MFISLVGQMILEESNLIVVAVESHIASKGDVSGTTIFGHICIQQ